MNLIKWYQNLFKKAMNNMKFLSVFDWAVFKMCLVFFGLMMAGLIPALVEKVAWWIYGVLFVLTTIYVMRKILSSKKQLLTQ